MQIDNFTTGDAGLTFATWWRSDNSDQWTRIFDFGNSRESDNILIITDDDLQFFVFRESQYVSMEIPFRFNTGRTWNHVVWALDPAGSGTWIVYINGVQVGSQAGYYPRSVLRSENFLGRSNWPDQAFLNGAIKDFRMYRRVLSATEAKTLFTVTQNDFIEASQCLICPAGQFSYAGSESCSTCPSGTVFNANYLQDNSSFVRVDNPKYQTFSRTYQECVDYATSVGGRLPTVAEVRKLLINGGNQALYDTDMWWPVSDHDNDWVEVGTWHTLGATHEEVAGSPPGWGLSSNPLSEKREFAMVQVACVACPACSSNSSIAPTNSPTSVAPSQPSVSPTSSTYVLR
jgi:hypothetical protein